MGSICTRCTTSTHGTPACCCSLPRLYQGTDRCTSIWLSSCSSRYSWLFICNVYLLHCCLLLSLMFFFSHTVTGPNVVLWLIMEHGSTIGCEARSRSKYRTTHGGVLYYIICVCVLIRVRLIQVTLVEETIRCFFVHEHFILSHQSSASLHEIGITM